AHRAGMHVGTGGELTRLSAAEELIVGDVHQLGGRAGRSHRIDHEAACRAPLQGGTVHHTAHTHVEQYALGDVVDRTPVVQAQVGRTCRAAGRVAVAGGM